MARECIIASKTLGIGFFDECGGKFELIIRVAVNTCIFVIDEGKVAINSNIPPDRVDEQSDKVESIAVHFLIFNEALCVCLQLRNCSQGAHKVRIAESSGVHVIGINVFSEADCFGERGLGFPKRNLCGVFTSKRDRKAGEFIILEIKVVKFSLPGPVNFKRSNNIDSAVKGHVFFSKLEIFSDFFALSNGSRFIELVFV